MTREASWGVEGVTLTILRHITSLGHIVSVHRLGGSLLGNVAAFIEMHAIDPAHPEQQHIVRIDSSDDDAEYRAACALAQSVGVCFEG